MTHESWRVAVERLTDEAISRADQLDGGEVGTVRRVELTDGRRLAVKTAPTPLTIEARMLQVLSDGGIPVPEVVGATEEVLVMTFEPGGSSFGPAVERDAADHLASLHANTSPRSGFPFDTPTGPFRQPNPWVRSWPRFYVRCRLGHASGRATQEGSLPPALARRVERVVDAPGRWVRGIDHASLLHGDVWTQNVLASEGRIQAFLDPACYYGDPEIELAYIDWTDTFGKAFFERYDDRRGIADGFFDRRSDVYRLYPLLTHIRYFGEDRYVTELRETLTRLGL